MKSDCCFDEGRLVPGRIKRAAIVSFALMLLVAACVAALTYTVRSSSSSSNEADKDLPVLKIGVTDNDPYVYVDTTGDYAGIDIDSPARRVSVRGSSHSLSILTGTIATGCSKTVISIACGVIILPVIARISITGPSRI